MKTRTATVELKWNGAAVKTDMTDMFTGITYTDPASGEADSLSINLQDRDRKWISAWLPSQGDTMTAKIKLQNWTREGDNRSMSCGFFVLDSFTFNGWPTTGTIAGVSVPADGGFRATERTKTWRKVTIKEIAEEIAKRASVTLCWDAKGYDFQIKAIEQSKKTDCSFLLDLCKDYGLSMKVYAKKLVIFDREAYKKKNAVASIQAGDIESWSWKSDMAGTYTGGEMSYSDPKTEKDITAKVGSGTRTLKLSGKADNKSDAERKIKAAVNDANHGATTLSITMMGNAKLYAGQCVTVNGVGRLSGKYYIDKITHTLGGGYTMSLELSLVESLQEKVIGNATKQLADLGVINSPDYWNTHAKDIPYLDGLLLNMATVIKANAGGTNIKTPQEAITVLTKAGVMNSPGYWQEKHSRLAYLDDLLIKAANAIEG